MKTENQKEHLRQKQREWRATHPGYAARICANWRANNLEKSRAAHKRYYDEHKNDEHYKERRNSATRRYRQRHPDRQRAASDAWAKNNPEARRKISVEAWRRRKARKLNAPGTITAKDRWILESILGASCLKCGGDVEVVLDHVIPLATGGSNHPTNQQPLCKRCNSTKGARSRADYRTKKQIRQLMHAFQLRLPVLTGVAA